MVIEETTIIGTITGQIIEIDQQADGTTTGQVIGVVIIQNYNRRGNTRPQPETKHTIGLLETEVKVEVEMKIMVMIILEV